MARFKVAVFLAGVNVIAGVNCSMALLPRFARSFGTSLRSLNVLSSGIISLRGVAPSLRLLRTSLRSLLRPLRGLQTASYVLNPRAPWPCTNRARVGAAYRTFSYIFLKFTKNVFRSALYVTNPRAPWPCTNRARVCAAYRTFSYIFPNFTEKMLRSALYVANPRARFVPP